MPSPQAFLQENAAFEAFLFAGVGIEPNGSTLTVLSLLARLDRDPWEEAASWATLSRARAVGQLTSAIREASRAEREPARDVATRLIQLLPAATRSPVGKQPILPRLRTVVLYSVLAIVAVFDVALVTVVANRPPAAAPLDQNSIKLSRNSLDE